MTTPRHAASLVARPNRSRTLLHLPDPPTHTPHPQPQAPAPPASAATVPGVRDLRLRAKLTQAEFAARLGVPLETIRNWEQGKRSPRGPARALLTVIAREPDMVFAALAQRDTPR